MRLSSLVGRVALLSALTAGAAGAAPSGSASPAAVTESAARAGWQRRAEAFAMDARFYRAAGKPAAAFLARRAAGLSAEYQRRALAVALGSAPVAVGAGGGFGR